MLLAWIEAAVYHYLDSWIWRRFKSDANNFERVDFMVYHRPLRLA